MLSPDSLTEGPVSFSFIWDAYQSARIYQLGQQMNRVQDAQSDAEGARQAAMALEDKIDKLALICRAMFEILQQTSGVTDEQLAAKIHEIDARDGEADGRMSAVQPGKVCPKCGATISPKFGRCLFCGYQDPSASPFQV